MKQILAKLIVKNKKDLKILFKILLKHVKFQRLAAFSLAQ